MKDYPCCCALRPLRRAVAVSPFLLMLPLFAEGASSRVAGAAPIQAAATKANDAVTQHTFIYTPAPDAPPVKSVSVAGTFNNWDKNAQPLTKSADGASWIATVRGIPYGKYQYKFVLNGETWITDPLAAKNQGGGKVNSVLIVSPPDFAKPARRGDDTIAQSALRHVQAPPYLRHDRGRIILALRARAGDVSRVTAFVDNKTLPMAKVSEDDLYALYQVRAPWNRKRVLRYHFALADGPTMVSVSATGVQASRGGIAITPFTIGANATALHSPSALFFAGLFKPKSIQDCQTSVSGLPASRVVAK